MEGGMEGGEGGREKGGGRDRGSEGGEGRGGGRERGRGSYCMEPHEKKSGYTNRET